MKPVLSTPRAEVYCAGFEDVAPTLADGLATLAVLDGPYNCRKAEWDKFPSWDHFREWYAPHLEQVSRILAPSANLYVWGTDDSASALRELVGSMGWTRRTRIIWDKGLGCMAGKIDTNAIRRFYDLTEVCDHYQRDEWTLSGGAGQTIAYTAGADERNWIRPWLCAEWDEAGLRRSQADKAMGTNGMAGHYFGSSQWSLPTWDAYQQLAAYAQEHGAPRDRPYLVLERFWPVGGLRATYDHLRAEYDHLRAEYEAARAYFQHPEGCGNVWRHPQVSGAERLSGPDGTLHPCQKPLAFYDRLIRSSSRPGVVVLEPFGGTLRAAVACQRLPATEARRAICVEPHRPYIEAVRPSLEFQPVGTAGQPSLFGGEA